MTSGLALLQQLVPPALLAQGVDCIKDTQGFELNSDKEAQALADISKRYFEEPTFEGKFIKVLELTLASIGTLTKASHAYHLMSDTYFGPFEFIMSDFVGRSSSPEIGNIAPDKFQQFYGAGFTLLVSTISAGGALHEKEFVDQIILMVEAHQASGVAAMGEALQ